MGNDFKSLEDQYTNTQLLIGLKENEKIKELNPILQCLCHIKELVNYTKYNFNKIEDIQSYKYFHENETSLIDSFKKVVEKIWPKDVKGKAKGELVIIQKEEQTSDFINLIYKINPNYKEENEFLLNFIITRLHRELNKIEPPKQQIIITENINKQAAFEKYRINFAKENQSKISDFFYGTYYTKSFCQNCQKYLYDFQPYIYGIYSINQVYYYKYMTCQMGQNELYKSKMLNLYEVTIYDCLYFDKQIRNYFKTCNSCYFMSYYAVQNIIFASPVILTFIFNKNMWLQNIRFSIDDKINISDFVEKKIYTKYDLIGIIFITYSNRYVAYCKNPIDKNWYGYDDSLVEKKNNFQEVIMTNGFPYMLFYQTPEHL